MSNVPIFYPTYEEFRNFSAYISKIESLDAHKIGLAKIVPPKEWIARKSGYKQKQIDDTIVENPIKQEVHGKDGFYSVHNIQQKSIKLNYFEKLCQTSRYATPKHLTHNYEKLERKYWQNLTSISPIYGADVSGSFYDSTQTIWNVTNLGTILDDLQVECGTKIEGVNTTYLYFGMWKATFAWHTEDMDLYSINYLHFGAPKQWYVIPPSYGKHFEKFAALHYPSLARRCPGFLRHKMTLIAPSILAKQSIPYYKMTQFENEFIITFPYAYHSGFNYGFNCAESTNFALERWIEYGKHAIQCACRHDMVKIDMDRFVLKYQPDLYDDWSKGIQLTLHPEDKQIRQANSTIIRSSPTKKRLRINSKHFSTNKSIQLIHQETISDERYSCIYRDLAQFDKQNPMFISKYSQPLIRAALSRADFKTNNLLNISARLTLNLSSIPHRILFHGFKQSNIYQEYLLDGLWHYQKRNFPIEQLFNQQLNSCAICYLFNSKNVRFHCHLFNIKQISHEILQCFDCQICVHQDCYENLCLLFNIKMNENHEKWFCQRCSLKSPNDHCTACLFRGGLLVQSFVSSQSFIHAICSIYSYYSHPIKSLNSTCSYCWSFSPLAYRQLPTHIYAFCKNSTCSNRFHVTCGLLNNCTFEFDSNESIINAYCHLHNQSKDNINYETIDHSIEQQRYDDEEDDGEILAEHQRISIGTRVRSIENNDERIGRVIENEISFHYVVDFGDGCYSHDMLAEDILDFDLSTLVKGSNIRIKWTDGVIYSCKYIGRKRVLLYHIEFDNETRQMRREEFVCEHPQQQQTVTSSLKMNQSENEHNYSRRQPVTTKSKRKKNSRKRKRISSISTIEDIQE